MQDIVNAILGGEQLTHMMKRRCAYLMKTTNKRADALERGMKNVQSPELLKELQEALSELKENYDLFMRIIRKERPNLSVD